MVISDFLLNKEIYEMYEHTYDIRKIFLVLYEMQTLEVSLGISVNKDCFWQISELKPNI